MYIHNYRVPYPPNPYYRPAAGTPYTPVKQTAVTNDFRRLWSDHIWWARALMLAVKDKPESVPSVAARMDEVADGFENALIPYYGKENADKFKQLFMSHMRIASDLYTTLKDGDLAGAMSLRDAWYKNGSEIASFLSSLNPALQKSVLDDEIKKHLELTEDDMLYIIDDSYENEINQTGLLLDNAAQIADLMSYGIIGQFGL